MLQSVFTMKLDETLREEFMDAAKAADRPASQIVRELMRGFIREQQQVANYDEYVCQKVEASRASLKKLGSLSNDEVNAEFARLRKNASDAKSV